MASCVKGVIRYANEVLEWQRDISSICASETNFEIVYLILSPAVKRDDSEKENVYELESTSYDGKHKELTKEKVKR